MKILKDLKELPQLTTLQGIISTLVGVGYVLCFMYIFFTVSSIPLKTTLILILLSIYYVIVYFMEKYFYNKLNVQNFNIKLFIAKKIKTFLITIALIPIILTTFLYAYINIFPAQSTLVVMENKEGREIIFRGMSHIGSTSYYNDIKSEIDTLVNKNDFVYYFEGVQAKDVKNYELLTKEIGIKATPDEYLSILGFRDIIGQNQKELNSIVINQEKVKNIDTYVEDMIQRKVDIEKETGKTFKSIISDEKVNVSESMDYMKGLNSENLKLIIPIIDIYKEGMITLGGKVSGKLIETGIVGDFFSKVILDYRNKHFVSEFLKNKDDKKVYVNYGDLHINGMVELLEKEGFYIKENHSYQVKSNLKFYK